MIENYLDIITNMENYVDGVMVDIPPLCDRGRDIELLTEYYVSQYNAQMKKNILGVSQDSTSLRYFYYSPNSRYSFWRNSLSLETLCKSSILFCLIRSRFS